MPKVIRLLSQNVDLAACSVSIRKVIILSSVFLFCSSCSHGKVNVRAQIQNTRAKADSYQIAVAVQYQKFQNPTGAINTFPNGGIPKMLDQKAKIYLCHVETLEIKLAAAVPIKSLSGWSVWILGWQGNDLYFSVTGQESNNLKNHVKFYYKIDANSQLSEVKDLPKGLVSQKKSGPHPKGASYVKVSSDSYTIDVRTDKNTERRTLFRTDIKAGELTAVTK